MARFSSADKIRTVVEAMRTADEPRAWNRSLINDLNNGLPPFSEDERKELRLQHNFNSLEGPNIVHNARRQLYNAFMKPGNYFHLSYDRGPAHMRRTWSGQVTRNLNKVLKGSLEFLEAMRSTHAQMVLHGIGPRLWDGKDGWKAYSRGIEDVLVPSRTLVSMDNLPHFAVYRELSLGELYQKTHGKRVDPAWNVKLAERIIAQLSEESVMATNWNDWRFPEKLSEDIKGNSGFYASDAAPTVNCWDFYFIDEDGEKWHRKMLVDSYNPTSASTGALPVIAEAKNQFLYDPKERVEADKLSEIMHVQFADCSNVGPFRWHSVRSLGYLLYNICHVQNRLRCRLMDAQQMELLWFFRNVPEEDREKLLNIQLYNMGIIPQGVDFVPGPERYHPDPNMISMGLSQNRQLMAENSASFVQDISREQGRQEETATLTMAKINNASALIGSMLNLAYIYETYFYQEIVRRFFTSKHPDCKEFRNKCQKQGVPEDCWKHVDAWEVKPERVLGAGNKTLEITQVDRMMAIVNTLDPEAQQVVKHMYIEVNSDDPDLAELLVPLAKPEEQISNSEHEANLAMGTLMLGLPVPPPREVSLIEYTETLLGQLWQMVQTIEQGQGMTDMQELRGLVNVDQHVRALIGHLARDEGQKERVRQMMDVLGKAENLIKAFAQRLKEQQESQQMDPETMAKIQAIVMESRAKLQAKEAETRQKLAHKEAAFEQKTRQTAVKGALGAREKLGKAEVDRAVTAAEMSQEQAKHTHQILMDQEAHEAEMERADEMAKAQATAKRNGGKDE